MVAFWDYAGLSGCAHAGKIFESISILVLCTKSGASHSCVIYWKRQRAFSAGLVLG